MAKRIFIALPVSFRLQQEILQWEKPHFNWPVRWLAAKDLHFTLVPPWYEENPAEAERTLRSLQSRSGPFKIFLEKVSYGPSFREPRLIWAEGRTPPEIIVLKDELEKRLKMFNARPFRLHLTLARFRSHDFHRLPFKKLEEKVNWPDQIESFVLIESRTLPAGAQYETLAEFKI